MHPAAQKLPTQRHARLYDEAELHLERWEPIERTFGAQRKAELAEAMQLFGALRGYPEHFEDGERLLRDAVTMRRFRPIIPIRSTR